MYNRDIETTDTVLLQQLPVVYITDEHNMFLSSPLNPEIYGGMSGYRYLSFADVKNILLENLTSSEFMAGIAAGRDDGFTLKGDAGGKSEVMRKFRNGVQTKITYNYRYPHDAYIGEYYDTVLHTLREGNLVDITLKTDCSGYREVYNLGNSFYVVDRFPPADHPTINDLDFATSWNLPANTVQVPGRPGCYEGSRAAVVGGPAQSKMQVTCKGFTGCTVEPDTFMLTKAFKNLSRIDHFKVNKITFDNNLSTSNFIATELSVLDTSESFKTILSESYADVNGRTEWTRNYADGSIDVFIVNQSKVSYSHSGITSDAYILIIRLDGTSNGNARLFDYLNVTAPTHTITFANGGQCDIQM